ncbi:MAG: hypothetical protein WBG32_11640 [Nodosilinea sp.]
MLQPSFRKAILKHQHKNVNANLIWGAPLPSQLASLLGDGCRQLHELGYHASCFPEGDGLTLNHPTYSPVNALKDICLAFPWLDIADKKRTEDDLYGDEIAKCKVLVPIEKLHLTTSISIEPYHFFPPIGHDESNEPHPWHEHLSTTNSMEIWEAYELSPDENSSGITKIDFLLTYPLVEVSVDIPYRELIAAKEYPDGMSPLLRRCSECADRGLDLIRLEECNYKRHEHLPCIAGQLLDGFHAAYVIPPSNSPFRPKLYCHFASPFQVIPNWLGLDVHGELSQDISDIAPIVFGTTKDEMSQRIRGAVRAVGQAFYILTPEARFLSLVVALDGLCSPKKNWNGLAHHSYIAAVGANGEVSRFKFWLETFCAAYSDVRNPIVHQGSSFIELEIVPAKVSNHIVWLIRSCINTVIDRQIKTVDNLHSYTLGMLTSPDFKQALAEFVNGVNESQAYSKHLKMPKWKN